MTRLIALLTLFSLVYFASALPPRVKVDSSFQLSVIHLNDFHARYEETNDDGGSCKSPPTCIGGYSRLYSKINELLAQQPDSLVLNGGDNFQGTLWYNLYKWNVTQYFINKIPFDAIVLGNHEFDDGIQGVVPFIKSLKTPVVVSNIDDSQEPDLWRLYNKSVVVERNGKKIGIIGVIIKSADIISNTGKLKFYDESASVNAEAERLVREEGVFTNIVLSHSGYDVEQDIGRKATRNSKIGLVVGAHSHTFLYSDVPYPGPDTPQGPYPTVVQRITDNHYVLVVQASAYSKYLGNITVDYDNNGNVVGWDGRPLFLDPQSPQDKEINEELAPWKKGVDDISFKVLGSSLVKLDNSGCYSEECLLGNFVTDVMVDTYTELAENNSWTYAALAMFNAGGLRTSIESGNITFGDVAIANPFGNTFDVGEIQGKYLKETFEFSVSQAYYFGRVYSNINLLQISGFHVVFNMAAPAGQRVESLKVRCNECMVPKYEELDPEKFYRLIVPSFVRTGGDGYDMITKNLQNVKIGKLDLDAFTDYLEKKSPVFEEIQGRIEFSPDSFVETRNVNS